MVANFLSRHFTHYVDYDFTAKLEDELDAVSRGEEDWVPLMESFWAPFKAAGRRTRWNRSTATTPPARACSATIPKTGKPVSVRLGRYGPYAQIGSSRGRRGEADVRLAAPRPEHAHDLARGRARAVQAAAQARPATRTRKSASAIGRFGAFAKRGSVYASLKKEDDPYTIDLARAVVLIEEKEEIARNRIIKSFDGSDIQVLNGRYGPYISDGKLNGRIPKDREPASLTLEEVVKLMEETGKPMRKGFGKKAVAKKAPAKKAAKTAVAKKAPAKKAAKKAAKKTAQEGDQESRREEGPQESRRKESREVRQPAVPTGSARFPAWMTSMPSQLGTPGARPPLPLCSRHAPRPCPPPRSAP